MVKDKNIKIIEKKVSRFVTETLLKRGTFFSIKIYPISRFKKLVSPPTFFMRQINKESIDLWAKQKNL